MNIKVHPVEIDPADPFSVDCLGRRQEIENLGLLIRNINSPAVLAVDSGWGTGKTTFLKMWAAQLELDGIVSLYFNAWDTDFSTDPLVAFLGEMNVGLKETLIGSDKTKQAWSRVKKVGGQIARRGLPTLVKLGTAGLIDSDKIVEEEAGKFLAGLAVDELKAYEEHKSAIKTFKDSLATIVRESDSDRPVVIFVDELDRCRPDYAIHLLERIKHLFDIDGIVFVLALDKAQLSCSMRAVYGSGLDADGYLRRFIDIEYALRTPAIDGYLTSLYRSLGLEKFFEARSQHAAFQYDWEMFSETFKFLCLSHKLSLREIEQLLTRVNLVLWSAEEKEYIYPTLLVFLIVTRDKARQVYEHYTRERTDPRDMLAHLHALLPEEERLETEACWQIEGFLIAGDSRWPRYDWGDVSIPEFVRHQETLENEEASREAKDYARNVIRISERPRNTPQRGIDVRSIARKIELLDQFKMRDVATQET